MPAYLRFSLCGAYRHSAFYACEICMCNTFLPGMGCIFLHVSFFYVHVLHFFICISFYVYVFYVPTTVSLICVYYISLPITVSTSLNMFIYNAYLSVHAVIYVYLSLMSVAPLLVDILLCIYISLAYITVICIVCIYSMDILLLLYTSLLLYVYAYILLLYTHGVW